MYLLLAIAAFLRLVNLGYSNLQGDEIKALLLVPENQTAIDFLLDQRKGPIQFLVTGLVKLVDPNYSNEVLLRLPFALASIMSVYVFYKLLERLFNTKVAFYATLLFSINGLFIAFGRIAQYQSFVLLFCLLTLYLLTQASKSVAYIYLSAVTWALSLLAHYDGIFIGPMVLVLVAQWFKESKLGKKKKASILLNTTAIFTMLSAVFYIPFALSLTDGTLNYWQGRIASAGTKISSSQYLFSLYNPFNVIYIYLFFSLIGLYRSIRKPTLYTFGVMLWALVPFMFMEVFVAIPGTHIYTYILPATILSALGIVFVEQQLAKLKLKYLTHVYEVLLAAVLCFFTYISYEVFINNKYEYPWEDAYFLHMHLSKPLPYYHLSLFGFPYNRTWEEIGQYLSSYDQTIPYTSNERSSISSYYIKNKRDGSRAGFYVEIVNPQSYMPATTNERILEWTSVNGPLKIYYNPDGKETARIYLVPTQKE